MTDDELAELKRENANLLAEKAKAVADWHLEVRQTLASHGRELATINASISSAMLLRAVVDGHDTRIKKLEDFKLQAVAYWTAASAVVIALWKVIDKFWQ